MMRVLRPVTGLAELASATLLLCQATAQSAPAPAAAGGSAETFGRYRWS